MNARGSVCYLFGYPSSRPLPPVCMAVLPHTTWSSATTELPPDCVKLFDILHIIYKQNIRNALTISCMEIDLAKAISFCLPFFMVASMVWKIHAISHDRDFKWNWDGCIGWWRGMHKQRMHIICPRIKIFRFCPVVYNMDNWKTCTKCLYTIYIVQYLLLHTYHNY